MQTVLVINAGSSSVKFSFLGIKPWCVLAEGMVERIGLPGTLLQYGNCRGDQFSRESSIKDTREAIGTIASHLTDCRYGVIGSAEVISAIGHRVLHGGEIRSSLRVDDHVKDVIRSYFDLGPLHNPANLKGIEACEVLFPNVPQVAVFDTAFHGTIPEHAFLYGIPYRYYRDYKIRRYGFHGISHSFVARETASLMKRQDLKLIICHLGNGCSISAVMDGRCVDTSMGLTPLEGLIMGTRSGDVDPAILPYLMERESLSSSQVCDLLNKHSGLLGMADIGSSDLRDILDAERDGNPQAKSAINAFCYRIKKYIGAYIAALGGLDALVFTAGIGENSPQIRERVCGGLDGLGLLIDQGKNEVHDKDPHEIQSDAARTKIWVIPTNEAKEIANQTIKVLALD